MENYSSIGFFLLNFAMQEGNKTHPQVLFDLLIQPHFSPTDGGSIIVIQSVAKDLDNTNLNTRFMYTRCSSG